MNNTMSKRKFRDTASFGKQQEYIAIAELLKRGHDVYMPLVDDQGIDCIIRRGDHDYIDLQIKAKSENCQPGNAGIIAPLKIPNPRDNYFFLLYCEYIDTYWIFPSIYLADKDRMTETGKNKGTYSINLTRQRKGEVYAKEEYSVYKNNFELLTANPSHTNL